MAIVHVIYAVALTYVATVALSLTLYGGIDYLRRSNESNGLLEAAAGGILFVFLAVFHFDGLTRAIPRQLMHGSLVSRSYVVLPAVIGVISTDYLLRRVVPLVSALVHDTEAPSDGAETTGRSSGRSRRSVLGAALGLAAVSLSGGISAVSGMLRAPIPTGDVSEFKHQASFDAPYFPTALDFSEDGDGYLTNIEGKIFRFERPSTDQESIQYTQVAGGIQYPQGVEVFDDTLYTVDNGSAAGGKYGEEEGYEVLQNSNGEVIAFDIESDGSLSNKRTVVSGLPVVNRDHALHQIVTGPDERLYLSIGHLGGQKYPELFEDGEYAPSEEDHPGIEYLGTVISFEPDGSDVEIVASGLRNVYDLTFDQHGNLFGANNDGMSIRSKVWESLLHITDGADFGYPEYGTFDSSPSSANVTDPIWTLDGVQSTGVETTDKLGGRDGVVVGIGGEVVFVPTERSDSGVYVPEFLRPEPTVIDLNDNPIIVEAGPDGLLWVGSTGREDTLSLWQA